ncbi:MAG TPA: hypothetical protein VFM18_16980 [Methanosarcina sp.]|nr:hypothetical protein [Methanosarcina sp.]
MNIYPSTKARPYVYMGIHKITKEIYIGYREKNVLVDRPSHIDLFEYRTSSKIVKPDFDNYNWHIIAEFFNGNDAYDFEQQLIFENWNNPLLLNKQYRLSNGVKRFKTSGEHSEETKQKMRKPKRCSNRKGKPLSKQHKESISTSKKGKSNGRNMPVTVNGITYSSKKDAMISLNLWDYQLNNLLITSETGSQIGL